MAVPQHRALQSHGLLDAIQLCSQGDATLLVICSTRSIFESNLSAAVAEQASCDDGDDDDLKANGFIESLQQSFRRPQTLQSIAANRSLDLAFCPDLARLRAFLARTSVDTSAGGPQTTARSLTAYSRLVIVNLLRLHVPTTSWSAQGINRSLALAVDAANTMNAQLLMVEETTVPLYKPDLGLRSSSPPPPDEDHAAVNSSSIQDRQRVWDEEVGIVDHGTKTFGIGSRGWAGRSVKVRQVLQRWIQFDTHESS